MTEFCIANNIEFKKSWNKNKIFKTIQQMSPQLADDLIKDLPKIHEIFRFEIAPEYKKELNALTVFTEKLLPVYQVLCFIELSHFS